MSLMQNNDDEEDEEFSSGEGNDDGFENDMEALRQACTLTGTNLNDLNTCFDNDGDGDGDGDGDDAVTTEIEKDDDGDDFELFKSVKNRFSVPSVSSPDFKEPLSLRPLCALSPDFEDDNEDYDFETLCAVQRRFAAYDNNNEILRRRVENFADKPEGGKACKVFPDIEEANSTSTLLLSDTKEIQQSNFIEQQHVNGVNHDLSCLELKYSSSFSKSAEVFLDAIKRNRSCQKFIRSKLAQIEARIEENNKLKERVKLLRDLQVSCRKITGRALAQGKDPRIQLISARRTLSSRDSKVNDNKVSAIHNGPEENSHVVKYRTTLQNYPLMLKPRKKWTPEERENLRKGIKQQFQEMVLQMSMDQMSGSEVSPRDANNLDVIFSSIRDMEISPERIREFLPKVNWDQLASLYVSSRSGAECGAQWLNSEDSLIKHGEWTVEEDKKLLYIIQEEGMKNWFDIAVSMGRNRTPFQCLSRFQRSLNARIIKTEWTEEEDAQLRIAVETFGENAWQSVASTLVGRTGPQCSNRWKKTLHPNISRVGRWTLDESKRLKVAVMLFGAKNWGKIAQFVPGRTGVQCRERWFNCVDPSLKVNKWSEEEDSRLKAAIEECGYCWSKVAKCLAPRTDNECRRRWMVLFPHEVPLLQAARRMQKTAIISNFVDREVDRPALGPHDFVPLPMMGSAPEPKDVLKSKKSERKTRVGTASCKNRKAAVCRSSKRCRSGRPKGLQIASIEDPGIANGSDAEKFGENDTVLTKRRTKPCLERSCHAEPAQDDLTSNFVWVTDDNDCDARKKKKLPKLHPKRNKLTQKEGGSSQCHLMLNHGMSEPGMMNGDVSQTAYGNNATSSGKKRSHRQHYRAKISIESCEEENLMLSEAVTDILKSCDHLDSSLNDELDDAVGNNAPKCAGERHIESSTGEQHVASQPCQRDRQERSKLRSKLRSKRVSGGNSKDNATVASFGALVTGQNDGRKGSKFRSKSCAKSISDTVIEDDMTLASLVTSVPKQNVWQERSEVGSESSAKRVSDTNDEDNVRLASFVKSVSCQRDRQMRPEIRSKSCSKRALDTYDEDNETLASFFKTKLKKRRI